MTARSSQSNLSKAQPAWLVRGQESVTRHVDVYEVAEHGRVVRRSQYAPVFFAIPGIDGADDWWELRHGPRVSMLLELRRMFGGHRRSSSSSRPSQSFDRVRHRFCRGLVCRRLPELVAAGRLVPVVHAHLDVEGRQEQVVDVGGGSVVRAEQQDDRVVWPWPAREHPIAAAQMLGADVIKWSTGEAVASRRAT